MSNERAGALLCPPSPCNTCPYRRDTPPGIWAAEEYRKLPEYDEGGSALGAFHCHHEAETGIPTVCRGWLSCHRFESVAVRVAVLMHLVTEEQVEAPCSVALYGSGLEACRAGLAGVGRPGARARKAIDRLIARRSGGGVAP